jgi:hypothetical protein
MLDMLNKTETETTVDTVTKRSLIEKELRANPDRSNREIARICGVDHKTVSARRSEFPRASKQAPTISPSAAPDAPGVDAEHYWSIPRQYAIECRTKPDGAVEIWQEGQHADQDVSILVAAGNIVQLARHLLYAAGFRTIGIYTHEKGGNVDVEDGHLASNFYNDDDKPGYGPVR